MTDIKSKLYELGYKIKSTVENLAKPNPAAEKAEVSKQYYESMKEAMLKKWQGK